MNKCNSFIAIFTIVLTFSWASTNKYKSRDVDLGTIIFASVLFRHGDRTPYESYKTDPHCNASLWPDGFAQLTNTGKRQQLLLGRWLRKRYNHMLPDLYSRSDIHVRSTDVDRTLMSAAANLAGLYPPKGDQVWSNLHWMPIPIHTVPEKKDALLGMKKCCPRYDYELAKVKNNDYFKRVNAKNQDLYAYLTDKSGEKTFDPETVFHLYDTLRIQEIYKLKLPEWTKDVFPGRMKALAELHFGVAAYNKALQRLRSGPLLGEIVRNMEDKAEDDLIPDRKLWMYSAHDDTVANMLKTLGVYENHIPPYSAAILIELRVDSHKQPIVTVSYKNSSTEATVLTLPGCSAACPLKDFIELTDHLIPRNWEKECLLDDKDYRPEKNCQVHVAHTDGDDVQDGTDEDYKDQEHLGNDDDSEFF